MGQESSAGKNRERNEARGQEDSTFPLGTEKEQEVSWGHLAQWSMTFSYHVALALTVNFLKSRQPGLGVQTPPG